MCIHMYTYIYIGITTKKKTTTEYTIKYSSFQYYLLSCIDPLLKLSQLNYGKRLAAKLLGNSREKNN